MAALPLGPTFTRLGEASATAGGSGGSSGHPLSAKEDPMLIYKLAVRGPGASRISKELLGLQGEPADFELLAAIFNS